VYLNEYSFMKCFRAADCWELAAGEASNEVEIDLERKLQNGRAIFINLDGPTLWSPQMKQALAALLLLVASACSGDRAATWLPADHAGHEPEASKSRPMEIAHPEDSVAVPAPPFSPGIFPCSNCHGTMETNPERRTLGMHGEIELHHGPRERWCFDCHNPANRDKLRLASGSLIDFDVSYELCGQCHGPKLRDWRAGVHGKRTGRWDGEKQYLLCVHCHNPHAPRFESVEPSPRPRRPAEINLGSAPGHAVEGGAAGADAPSANPQPSAHGNE
jgi:hypothetical protein